MSIQFSYPKRDGLGYVTRKVSVCAVDADYLGEETINTESSAIFHDCVSIRDVEIVYEDVWNYPNSEHEIHDASSKVQVLSVI